MLYLEGANIETAIDDAIKADPPLVIQRRRCEVWIASVNSRAARQQGMGKGRSAITLKRAEGGIGIDQIAGSGQEAAAVIAAKVVAV